MLWQSRCSGGLKINATHDDFPALLAEALDVLAALAAVDYVVVFNELDPARVIHAVRPDLLVKGGDWPIGQIVGADFVQSRGGRVLSLPYVEGASTSALIGRVLAKALKRR